MGIASTLLSISVIASTMFSSGLVQAQEKIASRLRVAATRTAASGTKSKVSAGINAKALWDGRKEVEFHSITAPKMVRAADAHFLIDDEYVLGISDNGESRAYPTRFASWHHIINDRIGKPGNSKFVTVTYCIVCNSGIRFDTPMIDNKPLNFDFYGLYNGVMTMFDKETESVWLQIAAKAVKGPLVDTELKTGPLLDTTWREWKKLHPDTLVMAPDARAKSSYEAKGSVMVRGYSEFPADYFSPTVTHRDSRLPMFELVLAVSAPISRDIETKSDAPNLLYRAYPIKTFREKSGVVNDKIGDTPVAVLFAADSQTSVAFSRLVLDRTLTLEWLKKGNGKPGFYDKETGSRWNLDGKSVAGPLKGTQLPAINCHMSQWYGWVSYFPQTSIYGQADKTKPAKLPAVAASPDVVSRK